MMRSLCAIREFGLSVVVILLLGMTVAPVQAAEWVYTVRPGDNIWNLTETYCKDMRYWRRLQQLNQVERPRHIPPGTRLRFPMAWLKHQPVPARVVQVSGAAQVIPEAEAARAAAADMQLQAGTVIEVAEDANLTLEFADGSRLLVQGGSRLTLDSLSAYGSTGMVDTRMRLQRGRVDTQVEPRSGPGSRYEIHTPAAVTAVRGTNFRVSAEAERPVMRSEVLEGRVDVAGDTGRQQVPAGYGTVAEAGKPPAPPRELLPAPDLSGITEKVDRLPVRLAWSAQSGAASYRAQVAPDKDFQLLLRDRVESQPQARLGNLPDGEYVLRVRAVDDSRLEGLNRDRAFIVDARPEPPSLMTPEVGATLREPQPGLQWTEPTEAVAYRVQLSSSEDMTGLLLDQDSHGSSRLAVTQALPEGRYYWRVASRAASGEQGPFSDVQDFRVRLAPPSPTMDAPQISDNELAFRWQAGEAGQRYQFQLADNADFDGVIVNEITAESAVVVPRPIPGVYYLRIRTLDTDGYEGPYGTTQKLTVQPTSYWPLLIMLVPLIL